MRDRLQSALDGIAHRTAFEVGGDTVGVLGTGLDVPYPPEHEDLGGLMVKGQTGGDLLVAPQLLDVQHVTDQRQRIVAVVSDVG
ncbi:MAG: DNA-processing protein DprA [Phycisphaerales bacterium]|nr:MAG: DNA-processing protein DprA [Phycisphaerales bacterium]